MNTSNIGVASSVSVDCEFDPFDTLAFAIDKHFGIVQPYMDDRLRSNAEAIDRFAKQSHTAGIRIVCHGPGFLNQDACSHVLLEAVKRIFALQSEPAILLHHDGRIPVSDTIKFIRAINAAGLNVQLENFYPADIDPAICVDAFCEILANAKTDELTITPVLDIPRLFVRRVADSFDSIEQTSRILDAIAAADMPLILHCIDSASPDQNRADWRPMGKGSIPYNEIASLITDRGIVVESLILEFEDKQMTLDSVTFASALLNS